MADKLFILLDHRGVLRISGPERAKFLQGLVSNDVNRLANGTALWSALLTPQGKFLHDLFIIERDEAFLVDCERDRLDDLKKKLSMYKLRTKVVIEAMPDLAVCALIGDGAGAALDLPAEAGAAAPLGGGMVFVDPRHAAMGMRAILPRDELADLDAKGFVPAGLDAFDAARIALGLPDGSRDMVPEKALLLENGFEELNGVDFKKGCYMGQELTARTKYRGLLKKRLMPVEIDGVAPEPGAPLMLGDVEAGEMRSSAGSVGLALIRLEHLDALANGAALVSGQTKLSPRKPDWANF